MTTPTLYKIIESELYKKGFDNEIVDDAGNLVFFDDDHQIMPKIMSYDEDVEKIMDELFGGVRLKSDDSDYHFKKTFMYRFINRQINRQTIEAFKFQLMGTFMTSENFINRIYDDMEKYLEQTSLNDQTNKQLNKQINQQISKQLQKQNDSRENRENNSQSVEGSGTSDMRSANAQLPQDNVQIDVNDTVMDAADSNEINRTKEKNDQNTTGESSGESSGESTSDTEGQTDGTTEGETEGTTNVINKSYQLDELFKTNGLLDSIYNVFDVKCFLQIW